MDRRWHFLLGTAFGGTLGCSSLVPVEEDEASTTGSSTAASDETSPTGSASSPNPTGPSPTGPNTTGPNTTGPNTTSPVTSATDTIGTTTTGVVDTGEVESGELDTGVLFDLPTVPDVVCIPPDLYGPLLAVHPSGWVAFEGCDADTVILQAPGEPALISQGEVEAVSATYGMALFGMPGAVATGMDLCCSSDPAYCLTVDVQTAELQLGESLAYANELFASLQTGCIGVRFNLVD